MRVLIRLTAPPLRSCKPLIKNNQLKDRLIYPYFYPYNLDWTLQFRHAPARLRVDANMFVLHAVTQLFAC
jgi:hypothetical protein